MSYLCLILTKNILFDFMKNVILVLGNVGCMSNAYYLRVIYTICPVSRDPFYIVTYLKLKMGHDFLDTQ